ncbi:MAG: PilN domain-containing protein [Gammaproteobacteria bacterium]|nr:PilN domain-containing protein [Gammaproteobacteria bacterium]
MVQMNAHLNQRIKKGKEELALLRDQVLRLQAYEKVERQITMLEDWKSGRQKTLQMFLKFVNDIPEDIGVERIERQEGKWTIEGEAPSRAPIVEWVRILTRQPIFQAVHLSSLDTKNAAVFHFRIQAKSFETLRGQI